MNAKTSNFDLVPAHLAVQAMRDNGYRNAAYAAAELIDNAVQAGASRVEMLVREEVEMVLARKRARIHEIAVLDNGSGMTPAVLRQALQFGNGSHLNDRSGIGRFGMGLPSASISQCRRVDVWTWQDGVDSAAHTFIDLDEVVSGNQRDVPLPDNAPIPSFWQTAGHEFGKSGTLVVWSRLDRLIWRTGKAVMENSEFLVARMYRHFLDAGSVRIRLATYEGDDSSPKHEWFALANDPGYLMVPSSTPDPYGDQAMFQTDGDSWTVRHTIDVNGEHHEVKVKFTFAKAEARNGRNAGQKDYGKHAARNIGVSLVRAGRELDLDQTFVSTSEARDRWWGVEVDFPPDLDELFGVTNNKQSARNFTELAGRLEGLKGSPGWQDFLTELEEEHDPRLPLVQILDLIHRRIGQLRNIIKLQKAGADSAGRGQRYGGDSPEGRGTEATKERQKQGYVGKSDEDEDLPAQERKDILEKELEADGMDPKDAKEVSGTTIDHGLKYLFTEAEIEGTSLFSVAPKAGEIVIKVNIRHPAYANLIEVLVQDSDEFETDNIEELRERLVKAGNGLKLLLMAWARFEDEQPTDDLRAYTQDTRAAWGQMAWKFLQDR